MTHNTISQKKDQTQIPTHNVNESAANMGNRFSRAAVIIIPFYSVATVHVGYLLALVKV